MPYLLEQIFRYVVIFSKDWLGQMEIDNFLPGSASLVDMVDKRLLVSLRDGRQLYGYLRSYDQFGKASILPHLLANLVLMDTLERIFINQTKEFAEISHGLFLVRGENVVLVGELLVISGQALIPGR